jgi:hypothetical protein
VLDVAWLVDQPRLHRAARQLLPGSDPEPTTLYVNVTAPMPGIDAGHIDVPAFRGLDRRTAPGWLLLAMARSGLFARWAVRTATAVVWFYGGRGGALSYWPEGPAGPRRSIDPVFNTALVGNNDVMFHRVEAVGDPDRWRPVPRDSTLHHVSGERWQVREGGDVVADYGFEELRVSLSWKAVVPGDAIERRRRDSHLDDLSLSNAIDILIGAMRDRAVWSDAPGDVEHPEFVEAVMATFPREVPTEDAHDPVSQ